MNERRDGVQSEFNIVITSDTFYIISNTRVAAEAGSTRDWGVEYQKSGLRRKTWESE